MKASNGNIKVKIFSSIFATVNLVLICGGLISCIGQAPKPLAPTEQQKPAQQLNQNNDEDKDDDDKDGDNEDDDDKDDDDKD